MRASYFAGENARGEATECEAADIARLYLRLRASCLTFRANTRREVKTLGAPSWVGAWTCHADHPIRFTRVRALSRSRAPRNWPRPPAPTSDSRRCDRRSPTIGAPPLPSLPVARGFGRALRGDAYFLRPENPRAAIRRYRGRASIPVVRTSTTMV